MEIDNYANLVAEQMKEAISTAFWTGFQYAQSLNLNDEEFVDLGLPSGTMWSKDFLGVTSLTDEGDFFSYMESQKYSIPTEKQLNELRDHCQFIEEEDQVILLGPNGNKLIFKNNSIWDNKKNQSEEVDAISEFRSPTNTGRCTFWLRSTSLKDSYVGYIWPTRVGEEKIAVHLKPSFPQLYKHQIRLVKCNKKIK